MLKKLSLQKLKLRPLKLPQRIDMLTVGIVLILLSIVIMIVAFLSGGLSKPTTVRTTIYNPGETAVIKNTYRIALDKVTTNTDLAKKMHLPDDQTLTVIHTSITNLSSRELEYIPSLHSFLRNNQGDTYTLLADVIPPALPPATLKQGQTISGNLVFVTESRNLPLWLYFDTHFMNQSPIVFQVNK